MPSLQSWNMRHPGSTFLCVPLRGLSRTGPQRPRILGKGRSRRVECSVPEESIHFKFRHAQRKFTWEFRTKNSLLFEGKGESLLTRTIRCVSITVYKSHKVAHLAPAIQCTHLSLWHGPSQISTMNAM